MPVSAALRAALAWGDEEAAELADEFLDHKVFTYVETLVELAQQAGADIQDEDVHLSDSILRALRDEARTHAGFVVDTYNSDLDAFLERNDKLPRERLLQTYEAWADDRADARAETVAITEAYSAAADATLAFYAANAGDVAWDFGGHPGDDEPACSVCEALVNTSPHPHERVLEVGNPHIGCRQSWHPRDAELPDELALPEEPAGVIGGEPWVNRHGNDHTVAAAAILTSALS